MGIEALEAIIARLDKAILENYIKYDDDNLGICMYCRGAIKLKGTDHSPDCIYLEAFERQKQRYLNSSRERNESMGGLIPS